MSKGLGKGLEALFEDNAIEKGDEKNGAVTMLRVSMIEPFAGQPRKDMNPGGLAELADSIAMHGVLQPIAVRPLPTGYYGIIAGERRYRASKMAGLSEVPVVIVDCDDKKAAELALVENLQRRDLNPVEEAFGYKSLIDRFGMTQDAAAKSVGKNRTVITNALRLLALPDDILTMLRIGTLTAGHARAIAGVQESAEQLKIAQRIAQEDLSVRKTEELCSAANKRLAQVKTEDDSATGEVTEKVDYIAVLEKKISDFSGRGIKIKPGRRVSKLEIEYTDNDDLELLLKKLCGEDIFDRD